MIKELKIYKDVKPTFKLSKWEKVTDRHLRLYFDGLNGLDYDDLVWAQKDMEKNDRPQIFVVEHAYGDGSVRVRRNGGEPPLKFRDYEEGELFMLIASFKEIKDGDT